MVSTLKNDYLNYRDKNSFMVQIQFQTTPPLLSYEITLGKYKDCSTELTELQYIII